ncbi:MAG: DNA polymerase III subunit alpha [Deltaproteobacteria bacterium]|nr:MAG: DNA polymerase III subunit alpha [Deltaproteobacteria bacterium]
MSSKIELVEPSAPKIRQFTHLHLHTTYSLLDGAQRIGRIDNPKKEYGVINRAKELGMTSVAMTDHGNMFGTVDFYKKARAADIKPILGCEVYMAPGARQDKSAVTRDGKRAFHFVILAQNEIGYKNLCKLVSAGYFEGFYYNPRIDKEILREHSEGLIGLSACLAGELAAHCMRNRLDEARETAKEFQEIFDGRYFIEMQMNGIEDQLRINPILHEIANDLSIDVVATNDVHYISREDAEAQDVLMAIQMRKCMDDPNRLKHEVDEFYLKSTDEMFEQFKDYPEACHNTQKVADMCNVELPLGQHFFPVIDLPDKSLDNKQYLVQLSEEGMNKRLEIVYEENPEDTHEALQKEYAERLKYELEIIESMGFSDYFLIVADFINWAKDNGIPVGPGRGSAAGSLVAFAMRITDIDPIKHDLLFERFLNPERVSMPDIDVDFCEARREEVIEYVRQKYAVEDGPSVAQIITFGKLKAKAVIRDVGRAYGMSFGEVDKIAKLIPAVLDITLADALQQEPRLGKMMESDPKVAKVIDIGQRLEGLNRHSSIHAAGVVISDGRSLEHHLPLYKGAKGEVVTQFDMNGVEAIGLIKFDFLGLKNLTLIANCLRIIEKTRGEKVDIDRVPLDAPQAFELLCAGDTVGVFQLESSGMREVMKKLKPSVFDDVIALVALYRPGPLQGGVVDSFIDRKHGREKIEYIFAELEPILKATYGVCIYQEQVMQIANEIASYSLGEADMLRRAMGKKKVEEMIKQRKRFLEGAEKNSFDVGKAEELFDTLEQFAKYGFNKCLVGSTEVMDASTGEMTTLQSLYDEQRPFVIHALNDDMKLVPRRVTDVIDNGHKAVFEVQTALGKTITATGNHPFRTLDGWTLLEKLKPGDRIAAPRKLSVDTERSWPKHELVTLAGLLSEGNTCHPSALYCYSNSPTYIDDFAQAIQAFPDTVARIYVREDERMEVCATTGRVGGAAHAYRTTVGNTALQTAEEPVRSGAFLWAKQLGLLGKKATEKQVPAEVFALCDEDLALFLGRLWSGDGYISGKQKSIPPFYATSSEAFARDVQCLLLRLGMPSRIQSKSFDYRGQKRPGFCVFLIGDGTRETFSELIAPHCVGREEQVDQLVERLAQVTSGQTSKDTVPADVRGWVNEEREAAGLTWRELESQSGVSTKEMYGKGNPHKRGFRRGTIATLARFFASQRLMNLATSDVYWDTITSIEPRGVQQTFDLTVEEDHNFVANGLIVHNSHSAAYGFVAYQTAYLKAYYRCEYMAALFTADSGNSEKMLIYLNDCAKADILVLPPDVNESYKTFAVVDGNIRFGLAGVKNVGEGAIDSIIEERKENGPYQSFVDFCERIDYKKVNRRVVESLIKCGAFDSLGTNRRSLFDVIEGAMQYGQVVQREKASAQISLFGGGGGGGGTDLSYDIAEISEWIDKVLLSFEKDVLGFYISGHPLNRYRNDLDNFVSANIADLQERKSGGVVSLAGIVTSRKDMTTKRGDRMAFVVVEDLTGSIEVSLFPEAFRQAAPFLEAEQPLLIKGDLEVGDRSIKLLAKEVASLAEVRAERSREIHVKLQTPDLGNGKLEKMMDLLKQHQGHCTTFLHITIPDRSETVMRLPQEWNIHPTEELIEALERMFGDNPTYLR